MIFPDVIYIIFNHLFFTEAEVLFVYNPQRPDELPLAVGQIITDVELVDDGWASGKLNGKTGMFPDNFVKIYKKPEAPPPLPDERPPVPLPAGKNLFLEPKFSMILKNILF